MKQRIIVIGGLAAGPAAAAKAKRIDPDALVTMYEMGEHVSYGVCEIPYWIGGMITDGASLDPFPSQRLEREKGFSVKTLHMVEEIDAVKRRVVVRDLWRRTTFEDEFTRLVIATGGRPRRLGMKGEEARNVFCIRSLQDARSLHTYLQQNHPESAVVIGGGYLGLEMCEAFVRCRLRTTLVCRDHHPLTKLEPSVRSSVATVLASHGVTIASNTTVTGFEMDDSSKVTGIRTSGGILKGDVFLVAIGVEPNAELARRSGVRTGSFGGIVTDERMATSCGGIYAAGDCCETRHLVSNRPTYVPLATTASRQGRVAGENAAGGHAGYKGSLRASAMKLFEAEIVQIGVSAKEAMDLGWQVRIEQISSWTRIPVFPGAERIDVIGVVDARTDRLIGVNLFGGAGTAHRANAFAVAIQSKLTLKDLKTMDLPYAPPFSPLWDPMLTMASVASRE